MSIKYIPKDITEETNVNVTRRHPLKNFIYLLTTVVVVSVVIFFALGYTASWLVTRISPENEARIGNLLYDTISETEITDDRRIYYLDELLHNMLNLGENARLPLTIHLIDTEVVNAAIMPGGHVLINTGLLQEVKSENELAFILAHELGHFQHQDPLKSLGRSLVVLSALAAVGVGTSSSSGGLSEVVSWTGEMTILHYSRTQERQADEYGLERITNHYGHGNYSLEFFNRLKEEDDEFYQVSQYFDSHPQNQERINYLSKLAVNNNWDMKGDITPLPNWINCPDMDEMQCEVE
ncbi:M48 family metallopeptidase [Candidatus Halobeggiatoa sp. HSG11]|nr:M48 family metallopeptidase [Candidatus Halobeggiatoa sp. HSG11]